MNRVKERRSKKERKDLRGERNEKVKGKDEKRRREERKKRKKKKEEEKEKEEGK